MYELVYKAKTNEQGQVFNNYYLVLDNGKYLPIKPSFKEDYKVLRLLAKKVD